MVISIGNEYGYRSSYHEQGFCILHSTNILGKSMNPTILPPAMSKIVGQTGLVNLGMSTNLGENNSEFKLVVDL